MATFCSLPPEIQLVIIKNCDFPSLLQLRQVSTRYTCLVNHELRKRQRLDVVYDYFAALDGFVQRPAYLNNDNADYTSFAKIIAFIERYMPCLLDLSLRNCTVVLTLTGMIQLASAAPDLYKLDVSQLCKKPYFEKNALLALPYFRKLRVLAMNGFVARNIAGKGCSHRLEVPPFQHMKDLESLELDSPYDTLSTILCSLRSSQCIMYSLKQINITVRQCSAEYAELLIWFLSSHRSLRSVHITNALFTTAAQLRQFYKVLILLPSLTDVHLAGCTTCDQVDSAIQTHFVRTLTSRGVRVSGVVRSMRYDPDGIY